MPYSLDAILQGAALPERIAARVQILVGAAPAPETVARFLERLRQDSPSAFDRIVSSPAALRAAVNLFCYSNFLSEAVLRNPERLLQEAQSNTFYRVRTVDEYERSLADFLGGDYLEVPSAVGLARFRRRQLLRIVLRDVLGIASLSDVTQELSNLADAILDLTYRRIRAAYVAQFGEPLLPDGRPCGFSVISLGKLGGGELNYSSDIDLMFVYGGNGETSGALSLTNKEFYKKVANQYTALLSSYTTEGRCYRVDLRLRPDGTLGEICISEEGARQYYAERARDWEKQMLIKARVSAGEREPGAALLEAVEPLIYQTSLDFSAVEAVSATRQRISEKVAAKRSGRNGVDVKLMPGGIRDIEFLVQCLQRLHGGREPWVRHGGTMMALFRLRDKGLLSDAEYARLATAYEFLRYLEHRLQMEEDRQTHSLPSDPEALELLARKMPAEAGSPWDGRRCASVWKNIARRCRRSTSASSTRRGRFTIPPSSRKHRRWRTPSRRRAPASTSRWRRARRNSPGPWRMRICTAGVNGSSIFSKKRSTIPTCWRNSTATKNFRPLCSTSSSTARTSRTNCCGTRNCWMRSAGRFNWRKD